MTEKPPYDPDTPEWQLHQNMVGAELAAQAFHADSERFLAKAVEAREKAELFRVALNKLTGKPR